jgi:hypothetical protein
MKNPFKGLFKKPYTDEQVTQASGDERNRRLIANDGYIGDSVLRILFAVAIAAMATALIHAIANAI